MFETGSRFGQRWACFGQDSGSLCPSMGQMKGGMDGGMAAEGRGHAVKS